MFRYQAVAALAAEVTVAAAPVSAAVPAGPLPLTPIQHWFIAQQRPVPGHWNQAVLLAVPAAVTAAPGAAALPGLLARHDAWRLRFTVAADGRWTPHYAAAATLPPQRVTAAPDAALAAAAQR